MNLQRKFALLLGTLALIVLINLGTALWSVRMLERELSGPLASIGPVLADLHAIKRSLETQARWLSAARLIGENPLTSPFGEDPPGGDEPAPTPEQVRARVAETTAQVLARLDHMEGLSTYRMRAGLSTTRNVRHRIENVALAVRRWLDTADTGALATVGPETRDVHRLIEFIEGRVLATTPEFITQGGQLRASVLFILGVSLSLMVLGAVLATILIRRWILRPVARLRDAAARIAGGDFAHRISVQGEDELALLSSEVNHMAGTIATMQEERVERERLAAVGEMVRRIAHNLRNPLAGIRSLAELTRSDLAAGSLPHGNQDRIVQTVDRFEAWLKDLLSATSPLHTSISLTAVAEWLSRSVDPLRPLAASKGVQLMQESDEAPTRAPIDPRHMEQALVALVTNAIQASPNGSRVTVSALKTRQDGNTWEVRVSDQGPGVPAELQEKIFRPYFTTKRDGTGIGLALAKQVVEQHGGRIWVEPGHPAPANGSVGGAGAVFVMRLPLNGPGEPGTPGQNPPARGVSFGHHSGH